MKTAALIVASVALATGAMAQPFLATLTFEGSTDDGATWSAGSIELGANAQAVRVRLRADWTPAAGYAFANVSLDILVQDAAQGDTAHGFVRPGPFDRFRQTIVATRFGSIIKIDDVRDTLPPDLGSYAVVLLQERETVEPDFDRSRPATVFLFEVAVDGTLGPRLIDGIVLRAPNGERMATVFVDPSGEARMIPAQVRPLTINVVPSPGAVLVITFGFVLSGSRIWRERHSPRRVAPASRTHRREVPRQHVPPLPRSAIWRCIMPKRTALTCCVLSLSAGLAFAQPFSATLAFEASTDGGTTWRGGLVEVAPDPVTLMVRVRADWTPEAGYAFRTTAFDVAIYECGEGDIASSFTRPIPFNAINQTIGASRFGTTIKIDDVRDTFPPGVWVYYIFTGQVAQDFNPEFNGDRPVSIFEFEVHLDGTAGDRTVDALVQRNNFNVPVSWVYTTPRGDAVSMPTVVSPLTVRVVPGPGAAAFAMGLLVLARRRRRRA